MQALKILNDDMQCDVIKIGGLVRNKVQPQHLPHSLHRSVAPTLQHAYCKGKASMLGILFWPVMHQYKAHDLGLWPISIRLAQY